MVHTTSRGTTSGRRYTQFLDLDEGSTWSARSYLGIHANSKTRDGWLQKSPSQGVSIRAISPGKYTVINQATNEVIEEVEENKAFFEVWCTLRM